MEESTVFLIVMTITVKKHHLDLSSLLREAFNSNIDVNTHSDPTLISSKLPLL